MHHQIPVRKQKSMIVAPDWYRFNISRTEKVGRIRISCTQPCMERKVCLRKNVDEALFLFKFCKKNIPSYSFQTCTGKKHTNITYRISRRLSRFCSTDFCKRVHVFWTFCVKQNVRPRILADLFENNMLLVE